MTFDYTAYDVEPSPTNPIGIVWRPELVLRVIGEHSEEFVMALVDTGADESVLPLSLAKNIGVAVDASKSIPAAGVGGQLIELLPGSVELEIGDGSESYRWRAVVGLRDSTGQRMNALVSDMSRRLSTSPRHSMASDINVL